MAWLVFLSPPMLGGLAVGVYPGYLAYEYAWKNEQFCLSCHVHDYANVGWKKSIHGDQTTCHDCHHQPLRAYIKEAWIMATRPPKFPKDLHHVPYVKENLCASCHLSGDQDYSTLTGPMPIEEIKNIPKVDKSQLHKVHLSKMTNLLLLNSLELAGGERSADPLTTKNLNRATGPNRPIVCADCHGSPTNRGHNFSAADRSCVRCHSSDHTSKFGRAYGCQSCHFQDFLAPVSTAPEKTESPGSF